MQALLALGSELHTSIRHQPFKESCAQMGNPLTSASTTERSLGSVKKSGSERDGSTFLSFSVLLQFSDDLLGANVAGVVPKDRPNNPRILIGNGHGCLVKASSLLKLSNAFIEQSCIRLTSSHDRSNTMHQEGPKMLITALGDIH